MTMTDAEKTDARRFCGYPAYGAAPAGFDLRFYQVYGLLEFRLNNLSCEEIRVVRRYLGTLNVLEIAVPRSAENLDTDIAAVWTRNRDEPRDRIRLFDDWRRRLCGFLAFLQVLLWPTAELHWWFRMDPARLEDRIRWGLNVAARATGTTTSAYRPRGAENPLAPQNKYLRLPAAFSGLDGKFARPNGYGNALWYGIFDAAYTCAGDYLVQQDATGLSLHNRGSCRFFAFRPTG